jgi:hypothetical protein
MLWQGAKWRILKNFKLQNEECHNYDLSPLLMLWIIFSILSFCLQSLLMLLPQIEGMVPLHVVTVDVWRTTRSCYNFKVWATWGATSSRRHKNKVHLLHFFLHLRFIYISVWVYVYETIVRTIVVGTQNWSYLLECRYIFLLGIFY